MFGAVRISEKPSKKLGIRAPQIIAGANVPGKENPAARSAICRTGAAHAPLNPCFQSRRPIASNAYMGHSRYGTRSAREITANPAARSKKSLRRLQCPTPAAGDDRRSSRLRIPSTIHAPFENAERWARPPRGPPPALSARCSADCSYRRKGPRLGYLPSRRHASPGPAGPYIPSRIRPPRYTNPVKKVAQIARSWFAPTLNRLGDRQDAGSGGGRDAKSGVSTGGGGAGILFSEKCVEAGVTSAGIWDYTRRDAGFGVCTNAWVLTAALSGGSGKRSLGTSEAWIASRRRPGRDSMRTSTG